MRWYVRTTWNRLPQLVQFVAFSFALPLVKSSKKIKIFSNHGRLLNMPNQSCSPQLVSNLPRPQSCFGM